MANQTAPASNTNTAQNKAAPVSPASPAKKSKKKLLIKIAVGVVIAIVLLVLIVNATTSGAVNVSNTFVKSIQAENPGPAYALFSKEAKNVVSESDFNDAVSTAGKILKGKPKMTSKEVLGETGSAATSKITYEIDGNDSKTYIITVNLTKEDGDWKVLNFDSTTKK